MIDPRRCIVFTFILAVTGGCSSSAGAPQPAEARPEAPPEVAQPARPTAAREPAAQGTEETSAPWFTEPQAGRGLDVFRAICAECHYRSDFRGSQFQFDWRRRTVGDLYGTIAETMPEEDPGGLDPQQYADVVAFILSLNGLPAGERELVADQEALQAFSLAALDSSKPR